MALKNVLITGGAGFIGRWLVARCLREGVRVTVYDNLSVGRWENIAEFEGRMEFIQGDILDEGCLTAALRSAAPETIFHLAAHHYIPYCNAHPLETLRVNAEGAYAVHQAADACGAVQTVVSASSGVLYAGSEGPLSEDQEPVILDVYGLSKLMTEQISRLFAETTPLRCVSARLFNAYGPYETNPHLIPHIMEDLHKGLRVELGNIHTKRDYVYVEDTADLLYHCAEIAANYTIVNVGTGLEYSVEDIIAEISQILGQPIEISVDPARVRPVDKPHQVADTAKLTHLTGARARHSLRDGLSKLLAFEGLA